MRRFSFSISVILIFVLIIPSANVFGFLGSVPDDIPKVSLRSFEFSLEDWENDGEVYVERSGISFYAKDLVGSGYSFVAREYDNRDVFVSVELASNFIDPMSIGSLVSDNKMLIYWTLTDDYLYLNFTLTGLAIEEFSVKGFEAVRYKWDYNYREKFRSLVHGNSVRFNVKCDNSTPNVFVDIPKKFEYYGKNITISGRGVLVKYMVKHNFKYPINDNRANPIWYEVRDIDEETIQLVVHFTSGISGDLVVVLNPVWYDYVTAVGMLDLFGWDIPVASL